MEINNLSRRELIDMIEDIKNLLDGKKLPKQDFYIENESKQSGLENLIGTIPFLLLNQDIFEKNIDIIDFAKNLGIHIPAAEKRTERI